MFQGLERSPYTTIYTEDLETIVEDLRSGSITQSQAADRIELLPTRLDEKVIGRRPIPNHLPSHQKVYMGVVALAVLGSAPTAVTVSDATVMNTAAPADSVDLILISKSRVSTSFVTFGAPNAMHFVSLPRVATTAHFCLG